MIWVTLYEKQTVILLLGYGTKKAADVKLNNKVSTINILARKWIVRGSHVSFSFVPKKPYQSKDKKLKLTSPANTTNC